MFLQCLLSAQQTFYLSYVGRNINDDSEIQPSIVINELIDRVPGLQNAWFSILAPGYHIPPHHGPTRAVVRLHLGLIVPEDRESCWIRVDDQICTWEEGKVIVFDDTYEHEVRNDTPDRRVVLFIDFDRPMDRIGSLVNRLLVYLIKVSNYVRFR